MTTVTFRQGVDYSGTTDVTIREAKPRSAPAEGLGLFVDGDSAAQVQTLLAFAGLFGSGPGQIPIGATITSATLTVRVTDATTTGISLSRMLTDWSETSSWRSLVNGVQLDGSEAAGAADFTIGSVGTGFQTFDVTASLQAWLSGAATAAEANDANNGWVFSALGTDGFTFRSSESAAVPVLTVTYTMPGGETPQLALGGSVSKAEGTGTASTAFTFTITRSGDATGAVSVDYAVTGIGTAPANASDFAGGVLPSGTITFADGQTSRTITINVAADSADEANETFRVTLSNPTSGAQISGATATGTIVNDDGAGTGEVLAVRVFDGSSFGTGTGNNRFGSTDPTDIAYDPAARTFFVCDSEVDETPFFASNNLFKLASDGGFLQGYSLRGFTSEPTGAAFWVDPNTGNKTLFICDDNLKQIFVIDPADPTVAPRSISTMGFGVADPEDLSINPNNGNLFVLSENDKSIYEITQSGAVVSRVVLPLPFKTVAEGMVYDAENDQFYVCGGFSPKIFIVSRAGVLTGEIDILTQFPNDGGYRVFPKGLELAPSSDGSGHLSLWVTDYGRDQVADGRVFEIVLDRPAPGSATVASSEFEAFAATTGTTADFDAQPLAIDAMQFQHAERLSEGWLQHEPFHQAADFFL